MKKLHVMTVVGTRPEIIRLSRVLTKLDEYCTHTFVHTGQNYDYELSEIFFQDLGIRKPDIFLNAAGTSSVQTIGKVLIEIDKVLDEIMPDAMLVLGDTNSCLALLAAKRRKIPTFHMEAGNRCFDARVPEEINRKIVDHLADINLTYSHIAREYLLHEGLPSDRIIKTGSPMAEVLDYYQSKILKSDVLERLNLNSGAYFLVSAHREENIESDKQFERLMNVLNTLAEHFNLPIIVSTHPRTQNRLNKKTRTFHPHIIFMKPLGFCDYVKLQCHAKVVLSDSGTISEESSILNFPALNIRDAHERPEGMEEASVMLVGMSIERIIQGITILETQARGEQRLLQQVGDYSALNVSDKVVRIIHSYTDYVNRVVWKQF